MDDIPDVDGTWQLIVSSTAGVSSKQIQYLKRSTEPLKNSNAKLSNSKNEDMVTVQIVVISELIIPNTEGMKCKLAYVGPMSDEKIKTSIIRYNSCRYHMYYNPQWLRSGML